jgi:hypothetical protein
MNKEGTFKGNKTVTFLNIILARRTDFSAKKSVS